MIVLGISAYYHDSSAAIINDGVIVAAVQEERFTRVKQTADLPIYSISYCLEEAGIEMSELDAVVFYENPVLKFDRSLSLGLGRYHISKDYQNKLFSKYILQKLAIPQELREVFGQIGKNDLLYTVPHHYSHAASAFYPSPFEESAILILDGVGEWSTTSIGVGKGKKLELTHSIDFPNSLGLLYSAFTYYCGFKVNSGEYKLMGLAPYGEAKYVKLIKDNIVEIFEDGSFSLNLEYFDFLDKEIIASSKFDLLFKIKARKSETKIEIKYIDIAASIQDVVEEIIIKLAKNLAKNTKQKNLVMAGGVALNCSANGKLLLEEIFENIWIQPASGDAGGSLGSALSYYYAQSKTPRKVENTNDSQKSSLLGPEYDSETIQEYLRFSNLPFHLCEDYNLLIDKIARYIDDGKIIGHFSGRMEYGPRALGSRSIIGDARDIKMQNQMNLKIKYRESFRPFAPAVLEEEAKNYFDLNSKSPYMLIVANVKTDKLINNTTKITDPKNILDQINEPRSIIPAVTHIDNSARVQTVSKDQNRRFYDILHRFNELTGCPICINTSFNVRGEPIVCTPEDAYRCFMRTEIDILILENCILIKEEQPIRNKDDNWKDEYELD